MAISATGFAEIKFNVLEFNIVICAFDTIELLHNISTKQCIT